jgi:spore maturation protein CgeB
MKIFAFGASILTSYWNGAATYYRGNYKYLARRGHTITFASPDAFDRRNHHDKGDFSFVDAIYYPPTSEGIDAMLAMAAEADVVVKHSGLGVDDALLERRVLELQPERVVLFWDVDAPATLGRMRENADDWFHADVSRYDAVLSYGGGPKAREGYLAAGAQAYYNIYNGLDPETHHPVHVDPALACDIAFLGNRLPDREARVEELFLQAAELAPDRQFLLGGEGWSDKRMPSNVRYIGHVSTDDHNRLNCSASMVMNINRVSMADFGFSPPTRVFEVSGAGTCMLCDYWPGIDDCFEPDKEILVVRSAEDVVEALNRYDAAARRRIGDAFHARGLRDHTYAQRALQVEKAFAACMARKDFGAQHDIEPVLESA